MKTLRTQRPTNLAGLAALALVLATGGSVQAASHREAPLMTLDPGADITDVYAFVSYDQANLGRSPADRKLTLIMNVVPGQEPSSGPNYYAFDDRVLYALHVDNNRDGVDDITYEFRFTTATDTPDQFIATVAIPPVTALEGAQAAGLSRKQRYTVTEIRPCRPGSRKQCSTRLFDGNLVSTVPSNIGSRTTPNYANLMQQGIFTDPRTGLRVFAGQTAETFAIDLGAVFDTINLRRPLPALTAAEDANDAVNPFGSNAFSGFNVNTIAVEIPISRLTQDAQPVSDANKLIGVYASTARRQNTLRGGAVASTSSGAAFAASDTGGGRRRAALERNSGPFRQVSRMANPLVNELIIPIGRKDTWNATEPEDEARFLGEYQKLSVAQALQLLFNVPVTPGPRNDIAGLLLTYSGNIGSGERLSELLRLDMSVPPTAPASIKRLGPFAQDANGNPTPDPAGFPNGRRPNDDVTDLVVRVAGGPNYINARVGDGVGISEKGITAEFPFLPVPFDGRDRRHIDCGEAGGNPC